MGNLFNLNDMRQFLTRAFAATEKAGLENDAVA